MASRPERPVEICCLCGVDRDGAKSHTAGLTASSGRLGACSGVDGATAGQPAALTSAVRDAFPACFTTILFRPFTSNPLGRRPFYSNIQLPTETEKCQKHKTPHL